MVGIGVQPILSTGSVWMRRCRVYKQAIAVHVIAQHLRSSYSIPASQLLLRHLTLTQHHTHSPRVRSLAHPHSFHRFSFTTLSTSFLLNQHNIEVLPQTIHHARHYIPHGDTRYACRHGCSGSSSSRCQRRMRGLSSWGRPCTLQIWRCRLPEVWHIFNSVHFHHCAFRLPAYISQSACFH